VRNLRAISLLASEAGPFISNAVRGQDLLERSNLHGPVSRLQLLVPKEREIDPFGQGFGGELRRLVDRSDSLDDFRCQKRKPQQSSHVTHSAISATDCARPASRSSDH
jgi:hypothetical protein